MSRNSMIVQIQCDSSPDAVNYHVTNSNVVAKLLNIVLLSVNGLTGESLN
jgi:hypothetical protein